MRNERKIPYRVPPSERGVSTSTPISSEDLCPIPSERKLPSYQSISVEKTKEIFDLYKEYLIIDIKKNEKRPIACIFGGQPACGKSTLTRYVESFFLDKKFLRVNGDEYRDFHPEAEIIKHFPDIYVSETQILSNVFTESLIDLSIKDRFNITVEGTMRDPKVPTSTADKFSRNGFYLETHVIAAPESFTRLKIYIRFIDEIISLNTGRLANIESHDLACSGLKESLDQLFYQKKINKISIHPYYLYPNKEVKEYISNNNGWNDEKTLPSKYIEKLREQMRNHEVTINSSLAEATDALSRFEKAYKDRLNTDDNIEYDIYHLVRSEMDYLMSQIRRKKEES